MYQIYKLLLTAFLIINASAGVAAPLKLPTYKINSGDFLYSQQTSILLIYKVPRNIIRNVVGGTLEKLGLEIAGFGDTDSGYIILKPMVFTAEIGNQANHASGLSANTEVELTALVYPKSRSSALTKQTFGDFLQGRNMNPFIGQLRLDVLCDNEISVAAGRARFGEHKFLGSFDYTYTTPNQLSAPKPFAMDFTAYNWQTLNDKTHQIFRVKVDLDGAKEIPSKFASEALYSSFPQEPVAAAEVKTIGESRNYSEALRVFTLTDGNVSVSYGDAEGSKVLKPAPPFGDGIAIPGSDQWQLEMREHMQALLSAGKIQAAMLFQPGPVEQETTPTEID